MRHRLAALLAMTAFTASTMHASATTIDFQELDSGACNSLGSTAFSKGFTFTGMPPDSGLFLCNSGVLQNNPTSALINANGKSAITMTQSTGAAFSLLSFYAGGRTASGSPQEPVVAYTVAIGIEVVGRRLNGSTVVKSFSLDVTAPYNWTSYELPESFSNLVSASFTALGHGPTPEFLIDDIVVASMVPEPSAVALSLTALVTIFLRRVLNGPRSTFATTRRRGMSMISRPCNSPTARMNSGFAA